MSNITDTEFVNKMNAIDASTSSSILHQLYHADVEFIDPVKHIHGRANLIEYFEEINYDADLIGERRIRVVTTTEEYCGSTKDPVISRTYSYL